MLESADSVRLTAKQSPVDSADCTAIGGGVVVIGRRPAHRDPFNLISAVSHFLTSCCRVVPG
jgi:hypothetical protein